MIIYRIQPSGREVMAEVIKRTARGECYVQPMDEPRRWIPKNWIIEDEEEEARGDA